MKLSLPNKIVMTAVTILLCTTIVNAEKFKFEVCERAETSLWDTIQTIDSSSDRSFVEGLPKEDQISYYEIASAKLEKSMGDVRQRCKNVSKDQLDAYETLKQEIQKKLSAL
jgi:hypothetical protein